jgi:hypothetical protein
MKRALFFGGTILLLVLVLLIQGQLARRAAQAQGRSQPPTQTDVREPQNVTETEDTTTQTDKATETIGVRGELIKAFTVAYASFLKDRDIPQQKKLIENYNIGFTEKKDYYELLFFPRRKPDERRGRGGSTELGKAVTYKISKGDYRIIDITFYR